MILAFDKLIWRAYYSLSMLVLTTLGKHEFLLLLRIKSQCRLKQIPSVVVTKRTDVKIWYRITYNADICFSQSETKELNKELKKKWKDRADRAKVNVLLC